MQDYLLALVPVFATAFIGVVTFMIRGYAAGVHKAIADVRLELGRTQGELKALHEDIRENTIAVTRATTELKAVWRYIDNAPRRASDRS